MRWERGEQCRRGRRATATKTLASMRWSDLSAKGEAKSAKAYSLVRLQGWIYSKCRRKYLEEDQVVLLSQDCCFCGLRCCVWATSVAGYRVSVVRQVGGVVKVVNVAAQLRIGDLKTILALGREEREVLQSRKRRDSGFHSPHRQWIQTQAQRKKKKGVLQVRTLAECSTPSSLSTSTTIGDRT